MTIIVARRVTARLGRAVNVACMCCAVVRSIVKRSICVRRRVSDTTQVSDTSGMDFGWYESCHSSVHARVPRAMLDQMMQFGRTKILLEPGALFASVTLVVKRYRVLNFRSDVRYRTAAAMGKFP